jgi:hypothetical protein
LGSATKYDRRKSDRRNALRRRSDRADISESELPIDGLAGVIGRGKYSRTMPFVEERHDTHQTALTDNQEEGGDSGEVIDLGASEAG